jgi:hypothetical protein
VSNAQRSSSGTSTSLTNHGLTHCLSNSSTPTTVDWYTATLGFITAFFLSLRISKINIALSNILRALVQAAIQLQAVQVC